jgi:hypothetical protein
MVHVEVDLAGSDRVGGLHPGLGCHIADIGESFGAQKLVGDI